MKFGKQFKKQMVPEWTEAYVDYNGLKRILGQILRYNKSKELPTPSVASNYGLAHRTFSGLNLQSNGNVPTNGDIEDQVIAVDTLQQDGSTHIFKTNFLRKFEEGGENEVMFFSKLDEELNKVNTFYRDKVEEVKTETALLSKQMNAFIALQIKVENPDFDKLHTLGSAGVASATPLRTKSRGTRTLGRECMDYKVQADGSSGYQGQDSTGGTEVNPDHKHDLLEILEHVKINNPLESPISSIKGFLHDSKEEELRFKKEEIKKVKERLRHVFMEFYQKLHLLKHYSFMNLCAFSKIMKKYEKFTSRRAARSYMEIVDNSYLGSCDEVIGLLERVEATFIEHFSNSNRREAMKLLRPKAKRERHNVTFFSGFFSGCSVALLVGIVLRLEAPDLMATEEVTLYMEKIFPLYSLFAFIVLHMLMYAANIYFWRRYRVNYPFIFGFKQGTELGYREVFFLASGLAVLALASFLTNLHLDMSSGRRYYKTVTQLVPLGLVTVVLVVTFCPFDIIYRSSRFFFIRCIFHCLCAPFYQVKLPDFFLADQLTSQVQAIRSLELYVCYYSLGEFSSRENKCHSDGVYNAFYFIVAVIPYWLRFLQ